MKQKLYDKVTQYILNNDPCTSEVINKLGMTSSSLSATLCSIRNKNEVLYKTLYNILEKNSYKNIKGYKLALEIIEKKLSKDELKEYFGINTNTIENHLKILQKHNVDLYNLAYTHLNNIKKSSKNKITIHKNEKLAAYIIANNSTIEQAMEHFNYNQNSFWAAIYSLKRKDKQTYNKVKNIIGSYNNRNAKNFVNGITKYEQICSYIIEKNISINEAAAYFNISIISVRQAIFKMARIYKPELFKKIKIIINNLPNKQEKMIQYMVDNNLTINETAKIFKVTRNTVLINISRIRDTNPQLFIKAELLKKKDKKYIQLADYIINNNATIEEVSTKFNMTNQMVRIYIHNMKKQAPEIYKKVSAKL